MKQIDFNNEKEILNYNRMIADFMPETHFIDMGFKSKESCLQKVTSGFDAYISYHKSWEWIMPVVTEINYCHDHAYDFTIYTMDCEINNTNGKKSFKVAWCEGLFNPDELIRSIYSTIVNFMLYLKREKEKQGAKVLGENSILLAKFEGYKSDENSIYYSEDNERHITDTAYHNNWNWLMPVIFKIKQHTDFNVEISKNYIGQFRITHKTDPKIYDRELVSGEPIHAAYSLVVDFLRWLETQK